MKRGVGFRRFACLGVGAVALFGLRADAVTNSSSVVDGAGAWAAGGSYSNVNAVAQPGGVTVSQGGAFVNYAGFLNTIALRPGLDTDGDGVPDEFDVDNDDDGLADTDELVGSEFDPGTVTDLNDADSDDDGMTDGAEATAGTDPMSGNVLLRITAVDDATNGTMVTWLARSNRTYEVWYAPDIAGAGGFVPVATVLVSAAAPPPWYVVTNAYLDAGASGTTNCGFYRVLVQP